MIISKKIKRQQCFVNSGTQQLQLWVRQLLLVAPVMRDGSWSPCDMEPLKVLDGVNQCGAAKVDS